MSETTRLELLCAAVFLLILLIIGASAFQVQSSPGVTGNGSTLTPTLNDNGTSLTYTGTNLILPAGLTTAASFQGSGMAAGAGGWFPSTTAFCWNAANVCHFEALGTGLKVGSGDLLGFGSTAAATGSLDTGFSRGAADVVDVGNAAADTSGKVKAAGYMSVGTTFTSNAGCAETTLVGGATAGKYTSVTAGTCTVIITMGNAATAPNGWSCTATDLTTAADNGNIKQTATSATTASLAEGTVAASDVIQFSCIGY